MRSHWCFVAMRLASACTRLRDDGDVEEAKEAEAEGLQLGHGVVCLNQRDLQQGGHRVAVVAAARRKGLSLCEYSMKERIIAEMDVGGVDT